MSDFMITSDLTDYVSPTADAFKNSLQQELEDLIEENEEDDILSECDVAEYETNVTEQIQVENFDHSYICLEQILPRLSFLNKTTLAVTDEENSVIDTCTDAKLRQLLVLNRTKVAYLRELCKNLYKIYDEINWKMGQERKKTAAKLELKKNELQIRQNYIWRIHMPYFKDRDLFHAPFNADYYRKRENGEYHVVKYSEGPKWSGDDQQSLHKAVLQQHRNYRIGQQQIKAVLLKAQIRNEPNGEIKKSLRNELAKIEGDIIELSVGELDVPPLNCEEGIDWHKISEVILKGKHLPLQCRNFWRIYLHPDINKGDWTLAENKAIKQFATQYKFDWDVVSEKVATNRTPFLLCVHYNTQLNEKFKRKRFTLEEDELLMEVVEHCRMGSYIPWSRVAHFFKDRSKMQLYHRYKYYLSISDVKKGSFTEAEDILVLHLIARFGKNFTKISEHMPRRSAIQLRNRYTTYLGKRLVQLGSFTYDEDKIILEFGKRSKCWSILAKKLDRTRIHVRQRYLTLQKLLQQHPELSLRDFPRRKQEYLKKAQRERYGRVDACLEKLKHMEGIPTINTVELFLKHLKEETGTRFPVFSVKRKQSKADIKLINFFKGTCRVQRNFTLNESEISDSRNRIVKFLNALKVTIKEGDAGEDELLQYLQKETKNKPRLTSKTDLPSSFHIKSTSTKALDHPLTSITSCLVEQLIPPNTNTLLALRGLIVKYHMYRVALKSSLTIKQPAEIQKEILDNVAKLDAATKAKVDRERELFFQRFCAVFKWPSIMSKIFPGNLKELSVERQEPPCEVQHEKKQRGRPYKKINDKVLKMMEARKRKQNEKVVENAESNESKKIRSGMHSDQREHSVTYFPRRSYIKMVQSDGNDQIDRRELQNDGNVNGSEKEPGQSENNTSYSMFTNRTRPLRTYKANTNKNFGKKYPGVAKNVERQKSKAGSGNSQTEFTFPLIVVKEEYADSTPITENVINMDKEIEEVVVLDSNAISTEA